MHAGRRQGHDRCNRRAVQAPWRTTAAETIQKTAARDGAPGTTSSAASLITQPDRRFPQRTIRYLTASGYPAWGRFLLKVFITRASVLRTGKNNLSRSHDPVALLEDRRRTTIRSRKGSELLLGMYERAHFLIAPEFPAARPSFSSLNTRERGDWGCYRGWVSFSAPQEFASPKFGLQFAPQR